jgi:hypothetical protein
MGGKERAKKFGKKAMRRLKMKKKNGGSDRTIYSSFCRWLSGGRLSQQRPYRKEAASIFFKSPKRWFLTD